VSCGNGMVRKIEAHYAEDAGMAEMSKGGSQELVLCNGYMLQYT